VPREVRRKNKQTAISVSFCCLAQVLTIRKSIMKIAIQKVNTLAKLPTYGSAYAAGADLYACLESEVTIAPHETVVIPTGIALELPVGYAGLIYARSGLATKKGLAPANKVGVVDCDYRGEVKVALHNHSNIPQTVAPQERVAQLVITPYITADFIEADSLSETARGAGGFGSTGTK
jgi:dUTP pyrophosphatase